MPATWGSERGAVLLNLVSEHVIEQPKPRNTLLPLLVVLFLVSYGLLALLVVEQGRTIDSQRFLIRELFKDSSQLTAMKLKNHAVPKQHAAAPTQPQAQSGTKETPSAQEELQENSTRQRKGGKLRKALPEKPPQGNYDGGDERRTRYSI